MSSISNLGGRESLEIAVSYSKHSQVVFYAR